MHLVKLDVLFNAKENIADNKFLGFLLGKKIIKIHFKNI
jgi:hypothetical protein